jgi:hypothetical protein
MGFAEPPGPRLAPSAQRQATLQGIDHRGIGLSTRDCRPFWPSCTFSVGRRFKVQSRLAYCFTPSLLTCCQVLRRRFDVTGTPTGALRSSVSVIPGIRHLPRVGPLQSLQPVRGSAALSPGRRLPLMEFCHSSVSRDQSRYRRIGWATPLRRSSGLEVFPALVQSIRRRKPQTLLHP